MILTNAQRAAFQKAQAAANDVRGTVEDLEELAKLDPRIVDRVSELRRRLDYLTLISETALALDRTLT